MTLRKTQDWKEGTRQTVTVYHCLVVRVFKWSGSSVGKRSGLQFLCFEI